MTKPDLYWVCRSQEKVMARLCHMMQLPHDESHLTEEELEQMHQILRVADDEAHAKVVELVRHYKIKRAKRDGKP